MVNVDLKHMDQVLLVVGTPLHDVQQAARPIECRVSDQVPFPPLSHHESLSHINRPK
jgi:hypothetical protein